MVANFLDEGDFTDLRVAQFEFETRNLLDADKALTELLVKFVKNLSPDLLVSLDGSTNKF
jgi:hypothetical protein